MGPKWGESVIFKNLKWYNIVCMYKNYQLTFFLVLIGKFDQKSNFQPLLAWISPYKSWWAKQGENEIFKSDKGYYIVSMYKYCQLTLFLVL